MIEVKQLRESISKALKEFYEVPLDESINMELVYFGKHNGLDRYELDGIEFFVAEDEDLQNAIETCIDEEFMPEWKENSKAVDFSIDSVDFIEGKDEKGFVGITVFGEDLDESLNEIHQSSPQLEIAHELRAGITQGDLSDGRSWSCSIDVVGQEGEDGDLGLLTKPLRDEALRNIADVVEEGNLKDILNLDIHNANLDISDKLSVKDSANKYPHLIEIEGDHYYFTIRFDIEMDEEDLDESLNESVSTENIKEAVLNAIKEYNHKDPDLMEYVVVECTEKEDGQIVVEVRDELSYDGMVRLAERLDRVVKQFDPEAYFDQECPGIMTAYINLNK